MKDKQDIINRTMAVLDNLQPLSAPLGFEEKLQNHIEQQDQWLHYVRFAVAALVLFAIINVFSVVQFSEEPVQDSFLDASYLTDSTSPILNFTEDE